MSKVSDYIVRLFGGKQVAVSKPNIGSNIYEAHQPFADVVFLNCVELLTDLAEDVTLTCEKPSSMFTAFKKLFDTDGKLALGRLFKDGFVVIGHRQVGEGITAVHDFHICNDREFRKQEGTYNTTFDSLIEGQDIFVMTSATYETTGKSDKQILRPWLEFLDNTMNASNTCSARLGSFVVCSPKNVTNAPAPYVLNEKDKKALEEEMGKEYGALHQQKQVMVLPREMSWQVVSLASLDLKTQDKAKMAVLAIADRVKVPANQVGLIDAMSSKSLANGTELREGDFNKYQSFERLLNHTFVNMAKAFGMVINYTIYNKPVRQAATTTLE